MYGLKYQCSFDPIDDLSNVPVYIIEIFQKGYSGEVFTIKGSTTPALHQWETDDPKAPIKGSSLSMAFINDGLLPLSSFFSTDDDGFKVRLRYFDQVLFEGFLVQDDCSEPLLDYNHEINLSANDNLGLLKDVPLDKNKIYQEKYTSASEPMGADYNSRSFLISYDLSTHIHVGDKIELSGTTIDGTYTVKKIVTVGPEYGARLDVIEPLPSNFAGTSNIKVYSTPELLDKISLLMVIRMCLSVTGLELNTNVFGKINEVSQVQTQDFLSQTLIDPQTFLKSDTEFSDCYDVLTKILERFNMTLFQANGEWNIVRWDELRYYNNQLEGYKYDSEFNLIGDVIMGEIFTAGIDENMKAETGLLRKILRPFEYDKETFNYQQPRQLLRNFDLKQLGSLIKTYTQGSGFDKHIISEYKAPFWSSLVNRDWTVGHDEAVFFIRVITDTLGNELERYFVLLNPSGWPAMSFQIEANKGDGFIFSCSIRTNKSQTGTPVGVYVLLDDGVQPIQSLVGGTDNGVTTQNWQASTNGWSLYLEDSQNSNQWNSIEINTGSESIPFDGLLYFCPKTSTGLGWETQFKDFRLEYVTKINESTKIIGHTHTQSQIATIKNNEDVEIFIDSSPRNSIAGTLFLDEKVGLLQKRTSLWRHPYFPTQSKKLGNLMTYEQLFWRRIPRTILEGTLYGLISSGIHLSLLSVIKYSFFQNLNFVFGRMEIDYKNNKVDGTLWELWEDNEVDMNLPEIYQFDYLYSTT